MRALYVDIIHNLIYASETGKQNYSAETPWLSLFAYAQSGKRAIDGFEEIYDLIDRTKQDFHRREKGAARTFFTYVFHFLFFWRLSA
jgi:hypothetical protein